MAMWDSTLLAYADRTRIVPAGVPPARHPRQRRRAPDPARRRLRGGVWRPVDDGIEATAFHQLPDDAWDGLDAEARDLRRAARRPRPDRLPAVRTLVGDAAERRGPHPALTCDRRRHDRQASSSSSCSCR